MIARMVSSSAPGSGSGSKLNRAQVCASVYRNLPWAALFAIAVVTACYSISFARAVMASPDDAGNSTPPAQLTGTDAAKLTQQALDAQALKEKLKEESLDAEQAARLKDDVKDYLEWVIAIAGIFAVAQTIAAGFAAQAFSDQAGKSIEAAEGKFGDLITSSTQELERFRNEYGGLVIAEETRKAALEYLKREFIDKLDAGFDWRNGFYESMDPAKRQWLLSAERYLGYDLKLDMRDTVNTPVFLRVLANFYVSKFEYENSRASGHISDLERAEYLLQLWTKSYPAQFEMRNDVGLVYSRFYVFFKDLARSGGSEGVRKMATEESVKYLDAAFLEFDASHKSHPQQQRAPYSLAFIAKARGELQIAIDLLEKAKSLAVWEQRPNPANAGQLRYNLACYRALKIVSDHACGDVSRINQLAGDLETVASTVYISQDQVKEDFDNDGVARVPKGDLYDFLQGLKKAGSAGQSAWSRIDALRAQLSTRK